MTDGTYTANITLLGQHRVASFTKASDGNGGTAISDPTAGSGLTAVAAIPVSPHQG